MSKLSEVCLDIYIIDRQPEAYPVLMVQLARIVRKMEWGLENSCCCSGEPMTDMCDACIALMEVEKILEE